MTQNMFFQNNRKQCLDIWLEPWGEKYTLEPKESIRLLATGVHPDFHLSLELEEDGLIIWSNGPNGGSLSLWKGEQQVPVAGFERPL